MEGLGLEALALAGDEGGELTVGNILDDLHKAREKIDRQEREGGGQVGSGPIGVSIRAQTTQPEEEEGGREGLVGSIEETEDKFHRPGVKVQRVVR